MKAGFAVGDITPELGIYLTGYGNPARLAEAVHSPLRATAMVLADGATEAAVISLDWCGISEELASAMHHAINDATGIPADHILVCATHTHSAPQVFARRTLSRTDVDPEHRGEAYARRMIPVIVETVQQAKNNMREAVVGFGLTKSKTGVSRRGMNENGKVSHFIADPYLPCDDNMTVVRFLDKETREDIGIFIHYGCHNTCQGSNRLISSDWCGMMRERVSDSYHTTVMFVNGSEGDVGPNTNRPVKAEGIFGYSAGGGDGERSVLEVGLRAATDALRALSDIRDFQADLPLRVRSQEIQLPQALPYDEATVQERVRKYESSGGTAISEVDYQVAKRVLEHWHLPPQPKLVFVQTVLAFGPVALAPFPFEMFSIFSLRLRKYGPFAYNLLCSCSNGGNGYLPDRSAIAAGGYEISWREKVRAYVTTPEAGDVAITQTLASLRELAKS